jgi:hypothetical protein
MKDLAIMDQIKGFPWKQLRALGIYKPMGSHRNRDVLWGWDHLTVACSRIVNEQFGFRYDDLETHIRRMKKKGKLMHYLFGNMPDIDDDVEDTEVWPKYFEETIERCIMFGQILFGAGCVLYFITSLFQRKKLASMYRGVKISTTIVLLGALYIRSVSRTTWARDIASGFAQRSPFTQSSTIAAKDVTLPVKTDILNSIRIHAPYLAGHNLIYNHQPGNAVYNELISEYSIPRSMPGVVVKDYVNKVKEGAEKKRARFLQQNLFGDWEIMEEKQITSLIQKDLVIDGNAIMQSLSQEMRFLMSECRHGRRRETALSMKHALDNLVRLEDALFGIDLPMNGQKSKLKLNHRLIVPSINNLRRTDDSDEVVLEDSLEEGEIVEADFGDDGWFKGKVGNSSKRKKISIHFDDGDYQLMPLKKVRRFEHFKIGEEVMFANDEVQIMVTIRYIFADGTINVETEDGEEHEVDINDVRRVS